MVTIVVLLILAGVSISLILDNKGVIQKSKEARTQTKEAKEKEEITLAVAGSYGDNGEIDHNLLKDNLNKVEGIKEVAEDNSKVRFIAVEDDKTTLMCDSLNNQEFYINKENVFNRYYGETQKELTVQRIRCNGLVLGLNLPPIQHHFHYCRSTIMYLPPVEKQEKTEYNNVDYIRKNNYRRWNNDS